MSETFIEVNLKSWEDVCRERDALKTDNEKLKIKLEDTQMDRDRWADSAVRLEKSCNRYKLLCEKFKEVLSKIANTSGYSDDTFDEFRKDAKEALEAWKNAAGK
jgi:lipoate-protein ligase A